MMENDKIQKLIDLYWEGITTTEEENFIRSFYASNENLSPELERWRSWFEGEDTIKKLSLSDDFDAKILSRIEQPRIQPARWRRIAFSSVAAAAAVILVYFSWTKISELSSDPNEMSYTEIQEEEYRMVKKMLIFSSVQINRAESLLDENLRKMEVVNEYINIK